MNRATCCAALMWVACAWSQVAAKPSEPTLTGIVTRVNNNGYYLQDEAGIDAPERCQAGGAESTAALTSRVLRREVAVRVVGRDGYGRLLGEVRLDGQDLGAWMVREGHAWSHRRFGVADVYASEEAQARSAQRGLFGDPAAIEPRSFRRSRGNCP